MENEDVLRGTIVKYIELLHKWNNKVNLVSKSDMYNLENRHINDSLQLLMYIKEDEKVFDIGSGAGFPGLFLSYAGIKDVTLFELNSKKANFLTLASKLSKNKIEVINQDVKQYNRTFCDIITCRGLAELNTIFELTEKLHKPELKFILLKGKNYREEIKNALSKWSFMYIIHPSETSNDGIVLEISSLKKHEK